jgi:dienelactone hydrolase
MHISPFPFCRGGQIVLTDYLVTCPHAGCHWHGSLLPRTNRDAWRPATPTTHDVAFECPQCHGEWHARLKGDDVEAIPLEEVAGHTL